MNAFSYWAPIADLIRLRNQTGTLLVLFPSLWALVLASDGRPSPSLMLIFCLGAFVMRSAGVAINDLWDRNLDRDVQRTQQRPLASGRLSVKAALLVFGGLIAVAIVLAAFLNPLTIALTPIAVILAVSYPLAKRVISMPQAVLGIAFGWGTIMAWAAVRNEIAWPAVGIFLATVCWAIGYDTIYALQDKEDDLRIGIRSTAILFGRWTWLAVLFFLQVTVVLLALIGITHSVGFTFYLCLIATAGVFTKQAWHIKHRLSPAQAWMLFTQHVWIGLFILVGLWGGILFK